MIEVELGEELIRQVELTEGALPDGTKSKSLDFDDMGNLHMMCRDQDGKLLKDVPVKEIEYQRRYKDELNEDYRRTHEEFVKTNRKYNVMTIVVSLLFGVLIILTCFLIWRLKYVV